MPTVNDVHSCLNATEVRAVEAPRDMDELCATLRRTARRRLPVAVAGGRHAMGGQQFCAGGLLIDMSAMSRPLGFDAVRGLLEIEAGVHWPDVIQATHRYQGGECRWAIRQDDTTFLPWARQDFGCVIFNLRTRHSESGVAHTAAVFLQLYRAALDLGGSFFLTYSRAAGREEVERAYPEFPEFLRLKRQYDPDLRFQSEWWRHYAPMFE